MRILCKFKEKRNIRKLEQHKRNLKPQNQLLAVDISTILFSIFVPNNIFLPNKRGLWKFPYFATNPVEMPLF